MTYLLLAIFLEYLKQARRREQVAGHKLGPVEGKLLMM